MSDAHHPPDFDLSYYVTVLLRRRWIVGCVWALTVLSAVVYAFKTRPVYQAKTLLVIEKERSSGVQYANGGLVESSNDDYYQTQYKLLKSESLLTHLYNKLDLGKTDDFGGPRGMAKLDDAVAIAPIVRSRLVYVRVEAHDPGLAARVANTLAETFVEQNLSNQLFISKEVLQALQNGREAATAYDSLPAVVNNTLIQTLKAEYAKLEAQAADLSAKLTPKHPAMLSLRSNMTALRGQIQTETDRIVRAVKTELSGQLKGNNVRIVDPAQLPNKPIRPKRIRVILIAVLIGLALGLAAAIVVEAFDQSIRTQEDVEGKLRVPFLGMVPYRPIGREEPVYAPLLTEELSLTSEAFRNLRTMVDFAAVNENDRAFLVTSSVQEEGKSYVAANIAVAFAQLGEKVLLIDGDLRRPKIHKTFAVTGTDGLSEFLAGGSGVEDLDGMLHSSAVASLKILAAGTRPPNPSELLNTPRVGAVLRWAHGRFDRVIVDCPPMFPINDTLLWGRNIPRAVFTVRFGATRAPLIRSACQKLETGGVKVLGTVVNAAKASGLAYSAYGYYYQQYYQAYHDTKPATSA